MRSDLILTEQLRHRAQELQEFVSKRENWFVTSASQGVPRDADRYKMKVGKVTVALTFTFHEGRVYRHMTASVPGRGVPIPTDVWTLAHILGFTTPEPDPDGYVHEPNRKWTAVGPQVVSPTGKRALAVLEDVSQKFLN